VDEYLGTKFDTKFPLTVAKDFVLSSDITWNTEYGGSGCGFVFRSDGVKEAPSQYLVATSRLADGHVIFAVMSQGELVVGKDFYANGIDPKFDASNGATNHLAVVAEGNTFTIYSNGTRLGEADPTAPLPPLVLPEPPIKPSNLSDPAASSEYQNALSEYRALINRLKAEYEKRLSLWRKLDKESNAASSAWAWWLIRTHAVRFQQRLAVASGRAVGLKLTHRPAIPAVPARRSAPILSAG